MLDLIGPEMVVSLATGAELLIAGGLLASAGAVTAQTIQANEASKKANRIAEEQAAAQEAALNEEIKRTEELQAQESRAAEEARFIRERDSKRSTDKRAQKGRGSTILTGPLGLPNDGSNAAEASKTLLGL